MIRKPLILGAATLLALALVAVGSNADVRATHIPGGAANMAIDADTSGNSATVLGVREPCVETTAGSDVTIDVTITDVPAANPMSGFAYDMLYNPTALSVTVVDADFLLKSGAGSGSLFLAGDESAVPDMDGNFQASALDFATTTTSYESGSGVLERLTITVDGAAAPGGYPLHLIIAANIGSATGGGFDSGTHYSGQIAVGVTCGSLPVVEAPPAINGDVDCGGTVTSVDALKVLRNNSALTVAQTEPCIDLGSNIPHVGDVDCNGSVNAVDALKILRKNAGLSVTQTPPCDLIGT